MLCFWSKGLKTVFITIRQNGLILYNFSNIYSRISKRNTTLVENFAYLVSVNCRQNMANGCKGEVGDVSANKRQGLLYLWTNRPENLNQETRSEALPSIRFVKINYKPLQRGSWKCLRKPNSRATIFVPGSAKTRIRLYTSNCRLYTSFLYTSISITHFKLSIVWSV